MVATRLEIIQTWFHPGLQLNTREIYELFLENYPRTCPTMYQLGNILGKSKVFKKVGLEFIDSGSRNLRYTVWEIESN